MTALLVGVLTLISSSAAVATGAKHRHHHWHHQGHQVNEDLVAARSHFFGFENAEQKTGKVDADKVIISWFSVSSYAVAAKGRVFLLDSYIYRLSDTGGYVPATLQELVDLDPVELDRGPVAGGGPARPGICQAGADQIGILNWER